MGNRGLLHTERSRKDKKKAPAVVKGVRPAYGRVDRTEPHGNQYPVMQVFLNAYMGWQHNGMTQVMTENGINPESLLEGQFVVFINTARDKAKIFAANNVIGYLRLPDGQQITLEALARIPKAFGAKGTIATNEPMRLAIETGMEMQPTRRSVPLPNGNEAVIVTRKKRAVEAMR